MQRGDYLKIIIETVLFFHYPFTGPAKNKSTLQIKLGGIKTRKCV